MPESTDPPATAALPTDVDDEIAVRRSDLDPRVWLPITLGFGDQSCFLHAGGMRAVMAFAERQYGVTEWRRVDRDEWRGRAE